MDNLEVLAESSQDIVVVKKKSLSVKHCEIVCDVDKMPVDVQETLNKYKTIKHWAYIIHDKDDTRPHYHIYVHFGGATCSIDLVAKWFQIPSNFIDKINGRRVDMLEYLTHSNTTQQNKHQYSKSEVHANFDFETEIANSKIIGDFKNFSYAQQLQYVNTLPIVEKTKAFSQLKKLWEIECQCLCLNTDRHIEVMFVTGKGGTGKTYYAKKLLQNLGYDFCISSSSNDPFQDYKGQNAIILDDMRPRDKNKNTSDGFSFEDLLKILDNDTASSVKSRFNNKVFNGKMIVITSSIPINYWFSELKFNALEDLNQLYRRITCYVTVTEDEVTVFDGLDKNGKPAGLGTMFKNELKELINNKKQKQRFDFKSAFAKICEPLTVQFEVQESFKEILDEKKKKS